LLAFVQPATGGPGGGLTDSAGRPVEPGAAGREYGLVTRDGHAMRRVDPLGSGTFPEAQEYASSDVYKERSFVYRRPYLGMGERTQNGATTPRYFHAWNAQTLGTMRGKGPRWHPADADGGTPEGPVLGFIEANHAGAPTWFILAGRYVRRHAGDLPGQQAVSLDLGAGNYARSAARWSPAEGAYGDHLLVTDNLSRLWQYDGAVWADISAAVAGADLVWSTQFELWRARGWEVSKCQADPAVGANWTLPTPVGDATCDVTGLADVHGQMFFFKADGTVWNQLSTTDNVPVFTGAEESAQAYNGRNPAPWLNQIYFRVGGGFYRLTGGQGVQVERVGPERLVTNTSPVRGAVRAFAGFATHYGFAGIYNPAADCPDGTECPASFLLRYGNWVPGEGDEEGAATFVNSYDGALVAWPDRRISALGVCTSEAVLGSTGEEGNPRLYAGFEDGGYGWIRLPKSGPNPFDPTSGCDFTDQPSFLRWPRHSMDAPADLKDYLSFDGSGPYLDPYRRVVVSYRVDPADEDDAWHPLEESLTQVGGRVLIEAPTLGKVIEIREEYVAERPPAVYPPPPSPWPPGPTQPEWDRMPTPVMSALILREQLRPAFRAEYGLTIRAEDWAPRRDGGTSRLTGQQVRALIREAADAPATVRLVLPDEEAGDFTAITYAERMKQAGGRRRYGQSTDVQVTLVAYRTQPTRGIVRRFFDQLVGDLGALTVAQCEDL
jgi:hypothetical protein